MKKIFLGCGLALAALGANAQSALDAYQFNQADLKGTSRFMSMGGAFGALGGDMTTLSQNPGGLGVYRSSEIGVTVNFDIQNYTTNSDITMKGSDFKFLLNNVGYIGSVNLNNSVMPYFNWGFNLQPQRLFAGMSGFIGIIIANGIVSIHKGKKLLK